MASFEVMCDNAGYLEIAFSSTAMGFAFIMTEG